jgi:hypothetical protein
MSKWEKKFGKYAIPNLTFVLIASYVVGYLLRWLAPSFMNYLTLNPYAILHGQVWRLVTWLIAPPSSFDIFTIIMLLFYFNLGTSLERTWGTWRYNVYIFTGVLLTVIGSFICMALYYIILGDALTPTVASTLFAAGAWQFSTYFINMSIFLAFAATFPEAQVMLMFVIPVKVKWLGVVYGIFLIVELFEYYSQGMYYWFAVAAIAASLLNFLIFYLQSRGHTPVNPKQVKRKMEFRQDIRRNARPGITKHKCAICGRTEQDDPSLEFRFCSKCNGNYEYCQYHLFTHEHRK